MKQINLLSLILILLVSFNFSCKKYLDEKSNASLVVPSTLTDFQNLLDDGGTMNAATPGFGASSGDDYFLEVSAYNSKTEFMQHVYRWEPFPYTYNNDWALCYKAIYVANLCLERIVLVERTPANATEWDNIKGAALFYKAFYELELAWLFAKAYDASTASTDAGIVVRNSTDFRERSVRSTVAESYDMILKQAKEAVSLSVAKAILPSRSSRTSAYGLLARTYLSMRLYDSAGRYANLALGLQNNLMNYNDAAQVGVNSSAPFKLFNPEVIFNTTMGTPMTLYNPTGGPGRVDTVLYASYHPNDLRKKAFFMANGGFQRFKGSYTGNNSNRIFSGIATDEMLLIRAECYARAGNKLLALQDLNALLQNRFATATFVAVDAATAAEVLEIILVERRKELVFRGSLRWMDVKRLNKEGRAILMTRKIGNDVYTIPPNDNRFALQIPNDVVELSGIQQN